MLRTATDKTYSEKKIDRIGDRLANIESYLKRMPTGSSPSAQGHNTSLTQTPGNAFASPGAHSVSDSSVILADPATTTDAIDATTNTHSVLASKVIEQAVGESPIMTQNPALATALASLKDMLGKINETPHTTDLNTTLWNRPIDKAAPPSRSEIYEILRKSDSEYDSPLHGRESLTINPDSLFLTFFPVVSIVPLKQRCESMFNHPKDCSPIRRVLVFGVLFELCMEYSEEGGNVALAQRYSVLTRMFLAKLEKAMAELPLIIKPSTEAVTALIIAVSFLLSLSLVVE